MWQVQKSALFKKQLLEFAENYKKIADLKTANRFLDNVDHAIKFIGKSPLACAVYFEAQELEVLHQYEFRKWSVKVFPHSIFFRIVDDKIILLEAIYAHRMNTIKRMSSDID